MVILGLGDYCLMAVSMNWGPFLWVSFQQEPCYFGSILSPPIVGTLPNIPLGSETWQVQKASSSDP